MTIHVHFNLMHKRPLFLSLLFLAISLNTYAIEFDNLDGDFQKLKDQYKLVRLWNYDGYEWPAHLNQVYNHNNFSDKNYIYETMNQHHGTAFLGATPQSCIPRNQIKQTDKKAYYLNDNKTNLTQPPQLVAHIPYGGYILSDEENKSVFQDNKKTELNLQLAEDFTVGTWVKIIPPQEDPFFDFSNVNNNTIINPTSFAILSKMPYANDKDPNHKPEWEFVTYGNTINFRLFRYPYKNSEKYNIYLSETNKQSFLENQMLQGMNAPNSNLSNQEQKPKPFLSKNGKPGVPPSLQPPPLPSPHPKPIWPELPAIIYHQYHENYVSKDDHQFNMKEFWWAQTLTTTYGIPNFGFYRRQNQNNFAKHGEHNVPIPSWSFVAMSFKYSDRINGPQMTVMMIQDPSIFGRPVTSNKTGKKTYDWNYKIITKQIPDQFLSSQIPINSNSPVRIGASTNSRFSGYLKGTFFSKKALTEKELLSLANTFKPDLNWSDTNSACTPTELKNICFEKTNSNNKNNNKEANNNNYSNNNQGIYKVCRPWVVPFPNN